MENEIVKLDEIDKKILEILKKDARMPLEEMSKELNLSKSTIHYRIKRLKELGVIAGFTTNIDYKKLGLNIEAVSCVKAKYQHHSLEEIAKKIREIPGVYQVYSILGEMDFFVIIRAKDNEELKQIVEKLIGLPEIERTSTFLIISSQ